MRDKFLTIVRELQLPTFSVAARVPTRQSALKKCDMTSTSLSFIRSPEQFYRLMCLLTKQSNRRISWSSLYLGVDDKSRHLSDLVIEKVTSSPGDVSFSLLCDYNRSSRDLPLNGNDGNDAASPLQSLAELPDCRVSLFQSPLQTHGLLGAALSKLPLRLPPFVREIVSVQHTKVYVFDDNVVISGANLSRDYFTDRQDRYLFIRNHPPLAQFYAELLEYVAQFSHSLSVSPPPPEGGGTTTTTTSSSSSSSRDSGPQSQRPLSPQLALTRPRTPVRSLAAFGQVLETWVQSRHWSPVNEFQASAATLLVPVLQFGAGGVSQETSLVSDAMLDVPSDSYVLSMASAYFNPTRSLARALTGTRARLQFIWPSARANGFHSAPGLTGWLPYVYTLYEMAFFRRACGRYRPVRAVEYVRPGWTFHSKGLWCVRPDTVAADCWTLVGSSNLGARSASRDLEASLLVHTWDRRVKRQMLQEKAALVAHSQPVKPQTDRGFAKQSLIGRILIKLTSIFFKQVL